MLQRSAGEESLPLAWFPITGHQMVPVPSSEAWLSSATSHLFCPHA